MNKDPMVPPQSLEAERALLGALLTESKCLTEILGKVIPNDLYRDEHKEILKAILNLYEEQQPVDLVTLNERLKKDGKLDDIGGSAYLTGLTTDIPTGANILFHAKIIKEKATQRELLKHSYKIQENIGQGKDPAEIIAEANQCFSNLTPKFQDEEPPISLAEFMKRDIPPLEYYVEGLLPKKGKGMISAGNNIGKSILAKNLCLAMSKGKEDFLGRFKVLPAKTLYLDLEMGDSAIYERFEKMTQEYPENLYYKNLASMNLAETEDRQMLESWLNELKTEVLIIDPLGSAWFGNENAKEEVSRITAYLNQLIEKYGISILIILHWRKDTKEHTTGAQMVAGSYWWGAWVDCHITLKGIPTSIAVACEKSRNAPRFNPFIAKINENLWFEFVADFEKKFDENTLVQLFDEVGAERTAVRTLADLAKEKKICSRSKVYDLVKQSTLFDVKTEKKKMYLSKKGVKELI